MYKVTAVNGPAPRRLELQTMMAARFGSPHLKPLPLGGLVTFLATESARRAFHAEPRYGVYKAAMLGIADGREPRTAGYSAT